MIAFDTTLHLCSQQLQQNAVMPGLGACCSHVRFHDAWLSFMIAWLVTTSDSFVLSTTSKTCADVLDRDSAAARMHIKSNSSIMTDGRAVAVHLNGDKFSRVCV